MEITITTTTRSEIKPRSYEWNNKVSDVERKMIALLYLEGFAVYNISRTTGFSTSTVEWHLKQMGVYQAKRRAVLWNRPIVIERRVQVNRLAVPASPIKALPAHIEAIYKKMEREDNEAALRHIRLGTRPKHYRRRHPHAAVSPRELNKIPFKAAYSFTL